MSKKKINYLFDLLYYAAFILIPIGAYLFHQFKFEDVILLSFFNEFGIDSTNVIFQCFVDMFGSNGFLPLMADDSTLFYIFTYMSIVVLMHLVFDFLMFIPKLAHKCLTFFGEKECK